MILIIFFYLLLIALYIPMFYGIENPLSIPGLWECQPIQLWDNWPTYPNWLLPALVYTSPFFVRPLHLSATLPTQTTVPYWHSSNLCISLLEDLSWDCTLKLSFGVVNSSSASCIAALLSPQLQSTGYNFNVFIVWHVCVLYVVVFI